VEVDEFWWEITMCEVYGVYGVCCVWCVLCVL